MGKKSRCCRSEEKKERGRRTELGRVREGKGAERKGRGGRRREAQSHFTSPGTTLKTKILVNHTYPP